MSRPFNRQLNKVFCLVLAAVFFAAPAFAITVREVKSPGGITAYLAEDHTTPIIAITFGFKGGSAIDGRTTRHESYSISQRIRKKIEEIFGWMKTVGGFRKTRYRGTHRTQLAAWWVGAAYNLVRMAKMAA